VSERYKKSSLFYNPIFENLGVEEPSVLFTPRVSKVKSISISTCLALLIGPMGPINKAAG